MRRGEKASGVHVYACVCVLVCAFVCVLGCAFVCVCVRVCVHIELLKVLNICVLWHCLVDIQVGVCW